MHRPSTRRPRRTALVRSGVSLSKVTAHLPDNYCAWLDTARDVIVIEGYDDGGWTLDGYVLPRLGSSLIIAQEVQG